MLFALASVRMADANVIADVSRTLESVLTQGLSTLLPAPPPVAEVHDLQGSISTTPARLTICLFDVLEDPSARNKPRERGLNRTNHSERKPPMALLLRYLLTPWSGNAVTDQQILGRTLQTLYDDAVLAGPQLVGDLALNSDALKVTMSQIGLQERTWFWQSVSRPYRLSLVFEVRVVNLDSTVELLRRAVSSRNLDHAVPEATP